jgi:spore coat-associated protein N
MFNLPRKRLVAGLGTALAAVSVAAGSGATFSSQTANPANTFTSGTFAHSNSKNGASIVTGANLKPGESRSGEVTITNTGSLDGNFTLTEKGADNPFTAGSLQLVIHDVTTNTEVYRGDLGRVAAGGISLGNFAAGAARTYRFTVTLAQAAPNADQGKTAKADYQWDAIQS